MPDSSLATIAREMLHHAATHTFTGDTRGYGRWLSDGLGLVCLVHEGLWRLSIQRADAAPSADELESALRAFAVPKGEMTFPSPNLIRLTWPCLADQALGPDSIIAQALPGYEHREPQIHMARLVEVAARLNQCAVIEAGTGTGKSLAYLAPLVMLGKRIVVSTANKALQAQLFYKDIPFLQEHLQPFTAALAKGRQNYLCLHKTESSFGGEITLPRPDMHTWYQETETGDLEELDFVLEPDEMEAVTAGDDECLRRHCPLYDQCWYYKAKRARQEAQVVVTNHMLLCLHLLHPEAQILPTADVLVIDEAHQLEGYAINVASVELTPFSFRKLDDDRRISGQAFLNDLALRIEGKPSPRGEGKETQAGITHDLEYPDGTALAEGLQDDADEIWRDDELPANEEEQALANKAEALRTLAEKIEMLALSTPDGAVRHVELAKTRKGSEYVKASFTHFDVSNFLRGLAGSFPTAIYTSATIAAPDFKFFMRRVGISSPPGEDMEDALTYQADSPFDFRHNARIYLPNGQMPDPRDATYNGAVIDEIRALVLAAGGGAFLLFTSYNAMNQAYYTLRGDWPFLTLRQGDQSKMAIMRQFLANGSAVLFATKSFWEGVDIKGHALRLVVIDKIPFAQPSPVHVARCDYVEKQGGSWFADLALPEAILSLKQGFGRLIRTRTDTGVVALLDPRITRKPYGKRIVTALPPAGVARDVDAVAAFYHQSQVTELYRTAA